MWENDKVVFFSSGLETSRFFIVVAAGGCSFFWLVALLRQFCRGRKVHVGFHLLGYSSFMFFEELFWKKEENFL